MQKTLKFFWIIFLCMQSVTMSISAYANQKNAQVSTRNSPLAKRLSEIDHSLLSLGPDLYTPAPVVPYHKTTSDREIAGWGILVGGIGLCVSLYVVISEWLNNKTEKKNIRLYTEMFKNLGYNDAQANAYAKIAVINSGGFKAVLDFIEREKEMRQRQ
jgi:hypothetical protein